MENSPITRDIIIDRREPIMEEDKQEDAYEEDESINPSSISTPLDASKEVCVLVVYPWHAGFVQVPEVTSRVQAVHLVVNGTLEDCPPSSSVYLEVLPFLHNKDFYAKYKLALKEVRNVLVVEDDRCKTVGMGFREESVFRNFFHVDMKEDSKWVPLGPRPEFMEELAKMHTQKDAQNDMKHTQKDVKDEYTSTTSFRTSEKPQSVHPVKKSSERGLVGFYAGSRTSTSRVMLQKALLQTRNKELFTHFVKEKLPQVLRQDLSHPALLPMPEYVAHMSDSVFALCPRGHAFETARLYEALEAGSIPILSMGYSYAYVKGANVLAHKCKQSLLPFKDAPFLRMQEAWNATDCVDNPGCDGVATLQGWFQRAREEPQWVDSMQKKLTRWYTNFKKRKSHELLDGLWYEGKGGE